MKKAAVLIVVTPVAVAWYTVGAIRVAYGIGRALVNGQVGSNKIYSESQR